MDNLSPVTQRDVAHACGMHQSTVCLALRNSPSLPSATRLKVRSMAERLGYRPNAAARNLSLLRLRKTGGTAVPIAWINQEPRADHWRIHPLARCHFEGARRRAGERGYRLEEIWIREPGMTAAGLVRILRARGVEGVILPVHRHFDPGLLVPAWKDFAVIGLNDHRLADRFDVVCADHFRDVAAACDHLRQLGFRRPGLALTPESEAASGGLLRAGFLRASPGREDEARAFVCQLPAAEERRPAALHEWLARHVPDAVITAEVALAAGVHRENSCPAWIGLGPVSAPFAAAVDSARQTASFAVDCVVNKLRGFEIGASRPPCLHLVPGTWLPTAGAAGTARLLARIAVGTGVR